MKIGMKKAKEELEKGAKKIKEEDLQKVLDKSKEIGWKFSGQGPLARYFADFKRMISLVKDWVKGDYRQVPWWSMAAIAAALLYVLNPLDLIPDFIPLAGQVDDALVIAACLAMVEQDLDKYRKWKEGETT